MATKVNVHQNSKQIQMHVIVNKLDPDIVVKLTKQQKKTGSIPECSSLTRKLQCYTLRTPATESILSVKCLFNAFNLFTVYP